jgi:hypothetical protein
VQNCNWNKPWYWLTTRVGWRCSTWYLKQAHC